ncbi:hypothetical protein HDV00_001769 [Rhizophlyctis rosea]|nr:hypothetical protein HDV00_001769 [Rhizophlyctis rosea]
MANVDASGVINRPLLVGLANIIPKHTSADVESPCALGTDFDDNTFFYATRCAGFTGNITSFVSKEARKQWNTHRRDQKSPSFCFEKLHDEIPDGGPSWTDGAPGSAGQHMVLWALTKPEALSYVGNTLKRIAPHRDDLVGPNTLFVFNIWVVPETVARKYYTDGDNLREQMVEDPKEVMGYVYNTLVDAISCLSDAFDIDVNQSQEQAAAWQTLTETTPGVYCSVNTNASADRFSCGIILYGQEATSKWHQNERTSVHAHIVSGGTLIKWNGNVFTSDHTSCHITADAFLVELGSLQHFPSFRNYSTLLHYLHYRLQTENTNIDHQPDWPEICFPFAKMKWMYSDETLIGQLGKPTQSIKTDWSVSTAWIYAFIRGWTVAFMIRSVGARATGLVGLQVKGMQVINKRIVRFLEDNRDQFVDNGWDFDTVTEMMQLRLSTDADIKWGDGGGLSKGLRKRRKDDPRRLEWEEAQSQRLASTPGGCFVVPTNRTGVEYLAKIGAMTGRMNHTVVLVDECAMNPSLPATGTRQESKMRSTLQEPDRGRASPFFVRPNDGGAAAQMIPCLKEMMTHDAGEGSRAIRAGSNDASLVRVGDDDGNDGRLDDDEVEEVLTNAELEREFKGGVLREIPHIVEISATLLASVFTNLGRNRYVQSMEVAPNYIGFDTPEYCISQVSERYIGSSQPPANDELTEETWWEAQGGVVQEIMEEWDGTTLPQSLLLTTSGTTSRIRKQHIGARAIVQNIEKPVVAIVNNGRWSALYFGGAFLHGSSFATHQDRLRGKLVSRAEQRSTSSGHHWHPVGNFKLLREVDLDHKNKPASSNSPDGSGAGDDGNGGRTVYGVDVDTYRMREILDRGTVNGLSVDKAAIYQRRHPGLLFEIALALFDLCEAQPRVVFLETDTIAGREKTCCSFDRMVTLTDLLFDHEKIRNTGAGLQTIGRVTGVYIPLDAARRVRRLWISRVVMSEFRAYIQDQKLVLQTMQKFPGLSLGQINQRLKEGAISILTNEEWAAWLAYSRERSEEGPAMMEGVTWDGIALWNQMCERFQSSTIKYGKRHHQVEIQESINEWEPGPRIPRNLFRASQLEIGGSASFLPPSSFPAVPAPMDIDARLKSAVEEVEGREVTRMSVLKSSDQLAGLWGILGRSTPPDIATAIWHWMTGPWVVTVLPQSRWDRNHVGLLAAMVFDVAGVGTIDRMIFAQLLRWVTQESDIDRLAEIIEDQIRPDGRGSGQRYYVVEKSHDGRLRLAEPWASFFGDVMTGGFSFYPEHLDAAEESLKFGRSFAGPRGTSEKMGSPIR